VTRANAGNAAGAWEQLARGANQYSQDTQETGELLHLISLRLAGTTYAVRVESVREIVRMRPITPIPRVDAAVRGVISLRGEMVQVIDLRARLRLPTIDPHRTSRIVVVHLPDGRVAGLLVDEIREVLRIAADATLSPAGDAFAVDALCACGEEFVSVLSLERVLDLEGEA
jgi:purine-binding chemotaxis protein CheW